MHIRLVCYIALSFFVHEQLFSQTRSENILPAPGFYNVCVETGLTSFYGDLDKGIPDGGILSNNLAFKIQAGRNFQKLFILDGQMTFGRLSGKKSLTTGQDASYDYFKTKFVEYTFTAGFNLIAFFSKKYNGKFNLYAEAGIGLIDIHARLYSSKNDSLIKAYGYGDQKATTEFTIPMGLVAMYHLSEHSAIDLHLTISRVDTDKLDALEGNDNRDYYSFFSVGYLYKICTSPNKQLPGKGLIKRK